MFIKVIVEPKKKAKIFTRNTFNKTPYFHKKQLTWNNHNFKTWNKSHQNLMCTLFNFSQVFSRKQPENFYKTVSEISKTKQKHKDAMIHNYNRNSSATRPYIKKRIIGLRNNISDMSITIRKSSNWSQLTKDIKNYDYKFKFENHINHTRNLSNKLQKKIKNYLF